MPTFIHLTRHNKLASIRRSGISTSRGVVYATPVTPNFYLSHQWLRELKRFQGGEFFAIYFRVPKNEPCLFGQYSACNSQITAAEAVGMTMSLDRGERASLALKSSGVKKRNLPDSAVGVQVAFERKIRKKEIVRIKKLPQFIGWRYSPTAKGRRPCFCMECDRGSFGIQKLLRRAEAAEARDELDKFSVFGRNDKSYQRVERLRQQLNSAN